MKPQISTAPFFARFQPVGPVVGVVDMILRTAPKLRSCASGFDAADRRQEQSQLPVIGGKAGFVAGFWI
jgi:hypothetical protein